MLLGKRPLLSLLLVRGTLELREAFAVATHTRKERRALTAGVDKRRLGAERQQVPDSVQVAVEGGSHESGRGVAQSATVVDDGRGRGRRGREDVAEVRHIRCLKRLCSGWRKCMRVYDTGTFEEKTREGTVNGVLAVVWRAAVLGLYTNTVGTHCKRWETP